MKPTEKDLFIFFACEGILEYGTHMEPFKEGNCSWLLYTLSHSKIVTIPCPWLSMSVVQHGELFSHTALDRVPARAALVFHP